MTDEERKAANRAKSARYRLRHKDKLKKTPEQKQEINKKAREKYNSDPQVRTKQNEANKKSKAKHADKVKAAQRLYDETHRDKNRQRQRIYYETNKPRILKRMSDIYSANPVPKNQMNKNWAINNPEKVKQISATKRSMRYGAIGHHTKDDIRNLFVIQFNLCVYCKSDLTNNWHLDHRMPLIRGGTNWPSNLQLLCCSCNMKKGGKDPDEYERKIGYKK